MSTAVISRAIRLDPQLLICRPHKGKFLLCRADSRGPLLNAEVLVFDVVNTITIQGLETRPTDSFALLVLSILILLLYSSGCPVLCCFVVVMQCPALF